MVCERLKVLGLVDQSRCGLPYPTRLANLVKSLEKQIDHSLKVSTWEAQTTSRVWRTFMFLLISSSTR